MKKKIIIIIGIIILIIGIIIGKLFINNKQVEEKLFPKIKEEIDNKSNLVIFITNTKDYCDTCKDATRYIEYYKDIYNLDVVYFDKGKTTDKDYKDLEEYIEVEPNFVVEPAVIIVKDKKLKAVVNQIMVESSLKNYLAKTEFIDEKELEVEKQITKIDFDSIYGDSKKNLILLYNNSDESYNYRKNLLKLSKEYQFNYNILYYDLNGGLDVTKKISKENDLELTYPLLIIVGDNKVIDYTKIDNDNNIKEFLRKNNIIN